MSYAENFYQEFFFKPEKLVTGTRQCSVYVWILPIGNLTNPFCPCQPAYLVNYSAGYYWTGWLMF